MKYFSILFSLIFSSAIFAQSVTLVPWSSDEGIKRLERSQHKVDFFKLANHFQGQSNKLFCGPATVAIVLNTLRLRQDDALPVMSHLTATQERDFLPKEFNPLFNRYSEDNIFTKSPKTKLSVLGQPQNIQGKAVKDYGFQVRQLAALFNAHGVRTTLTVVSDGLAKDKIKHVLINNLKTKNNYVVINYKRKALGQPGGGHISPLGAYDEKSDSFLIMDVNPNKAEWVWVTSNDLIGAMRTFDTVENRGFVEVQ